MGLKHFKHGERLKEVVKSWLKGDLINVYEHLMGRDEENRARLFSVVTSGASAQDRRHWAQIKTHENVYCGDSQTLQQVAR